MENYHKHTSFSNIFTPDSAALYEDYGKRAVELGHKTISSVEHGWQSNYYVTYETAKKYGLKFIFGAEAYWVKDRFEKDRSNCHIILLAKSEQGRRAINEVLSEANETGYYYRPRVDIPLLLSLPPKEVVVTSACVAAWHYEDADDIMLRLADHFRENFFFEVQNHWTDKQKKLNQHILDLSRAHHIPIIAGLDSHYIYPEEAADRDYILAAKGMHYDDEDGWFMDFPDDQTVFDRFKQQGVLSDDEIKQAIDNTNIVRDFADYTENNRLFTQEIKMPSLYPDKTQEEKNHIYGCLISQKYKEYVKDVPEEMRKEYFDGIKMEVDTYKETNMVDYPLLDTEILKAALAHGGLMTKTGRGSGASYFTNTLCGFSSVDRFTSPIKLYPERFISKSRILAGSLPDLDMNVGTPDIFEEAQARVMARIPGQHHCYPMIAFGTAKKKSAFKLYARAQKMDATLATTIAGQIEKYETAVKFADDDERDDIDIYDYVDKQYQPYIEQSKKYWGIIMDKKKAPCSYLLYDGDLRSEIGLIKCKSESTKKECITTVVDGAVAEGYKFLKNDVLKVDCVLQTAKIYDRIGIPQHSVGELMHIIDNDPATWAIYENGYTIGVNQCERDTTTAKLKRYKPKNLSELAAFIAAIRPGFKSMYSKFESREPFEYGIPSLDRLIQTKQFPYSYILYQEQLMAVLHFAGFPMDQCYTIIKAIAKKHPEKVRPLKEEFLVNCAAKIRPECKSDEEAKSFAEQIWKIIDDSTSYSFNSSHALCVALDSLYSAWQKAHYPYEFYEVMLQMFSDKGKKDKVAALKREMQHFGISEGSYRFGLDNRSFVADKSRHTINPALVSIKGLSQKNADDLYKLSRRFTGTHFYDLYKEMKQIKSLDAGKLNILAEIGYFNQFGSVEKVLTFMQAIGDLYGRSQFVKDALPDAYRDLIVRHSEETEKQYRNFDSDKALYELWDQIPNQPPTMRETLRRESEYLGYLSTTYPEMSDNYVFVCGYECKFTNPKLTLYQMKSGKTVEIKVRRKQYDANPIKVNDVIRIVEWRREGKWSKDADGDWVQDKTNKELILKEWCKLENV